MADLKGSEFCVACPEEVLGSNRGPVSVLWKIAGRVESGMGRRQLGDLRYESWSDGTVLVYLEPAPGRGSRRAAPRLPDGPGTGPALRCLMYIGGAVTGVATAAIVLAVSLLIDGDLVPGVLVGVVAVVALIVGLLLMLALALQRLIRRGFGRKLGARAGAAFELAWAEVQVRLGTAPEPGEVTAAKHHLWTLAGDLQLESVRSPGRRPIE